MSPVEIATECRGKALRTQRVGLSLCNEVQWLDTRFEDRSGTSIQRRRKLRMLREPKSSHDKGGPE